MEFDIHQKSSELLEKLANSIYDRDPSNPNPLFFSMNEIHIVEKWLKDILLEQLNDLKNDINHSITENNFKGKLLC